MIVWGSIGGYLLIGIAGFLVALHWLGWDNAKNSYNPDFQLSDGDVGGATLIGFLWPIAIVVLLCVAVVKSATQGHLGRIVEGRPPKSMRKEILQRRINRNERSLGIGNPTTIHEGRQCPSQETNWSTRAYRS